ncbi:hypothetical protein [uncultured Kordia sp.]|uniref:hypothetical protein n=1 Tax=uncultured Kordia sp. TaxID=507699 RepID=UPI002632A621|nr:hypothetical protein [uncultured Kordia sp.]
MTQSNHRKAILLFIIGILCIVFSQIISHYLEVSDLANGIFKGIGFGVLIIAVMNLAKPKTAKPIKVRNDV